MKEKSFFIIFKGLSVATRCLRPESAPLNSYTQVGLRPRLIYQLKKTIKERLTSNISRNFRKSNKY